MSITFQLARHKIRPGVEVVEVWDGGKFMASIYPTTHGIRMVSGYLKDTPGTIVEQEFLFEDTE
jgi:hypothetical protein